MWAAVAADVNVLRWPNTAFAPPGAVVRTTAPTVNISDDAAPAYTSVRFTGTVADARNETMGFRLVTDGSAYVWVRSAPSPAPTLG